MVTIRLHASRPETLLSGPATARPVVPEGLIDFLEDVGSTLLSMFGAPFRPRPSARHFPGGRALDPSTLRDIGLDR